MVPCDQRLLVLGNNNCSQGMPPVRHQQFVSATGLIPCRNTLPGIKLGHRRLHNAIAIMTNVPARLGVQQAQISIALNTQPRNVGPVRAEVD